MKESERKELEKMQKLRKTIEASPLVKKAQEEEAAAIQKERDAAAAEIKCIEAEKKDLLPPLQMKLGGLLEDLAEAEEKVRILQGGANDMKRQISYINFGLEGRKGKAEDVLRDSCADQIHEAIKFFRDTLEKLRRPMAISRVGRPSKKNWVSWKKSTVSESNYDAVTAAMQYCQKAIEHLEAMKLEAHFDIKKLEELKSGIPPTDVYEEHHGEKPLAKVNTDPRSLLPSDSEMEWRMRQLDKKFKKLMK